MRSGRCIPTSPRPTGKCLLAPNLGWKDVPVADIFSEALGVPTFVVNNADAAVVVESTEGAAKGARNVVLLHVGRGVGAQHRTAVSLAVEARQIPAMIDVCVRQNNRIEIGRLVKERLVLPSGLGAMSLKEPAIEQDFQPTTFDQMLAAGDFARGSAESDFHRFRVFVQKL